MCGSGSSAVADPDFYKGKTISLQVGFGAGGEDDLWARTISRHLGNHIPGAPTIVIQNLPGSGGLLVANRLFGLAPRDGTVIGMINRGIPFEPLFGGQGAQFDPLKFNYIGSPSRDTTVCAVRKDATVKRLEDLATHELAVGATGSGADTAIYPELLSALLGMKFKLVKGYKGSHDIQLAMERNEVQGICLAYDSLSRGTLARAGQINILFQAAMQPDDRLYNVPLAITAARSNEQRQVLELFFARALVGRPFVMPPEVPSDRIAIIRRAFQETLSDPAFQSEAERQNLRISPVDGDEIARVVSRAYKSDAAVVSQTIRALRRH